MKAHELLSSPDAWCQESPAEDAQGNKVQAFESEGGEMVRSRCDSKDLPSIAVGRDDGSPVARAQRFRKGDSSTDKIRQGLFLD